MSTISSTRGAAAIRHHDAEATPRSGPDRRIILCADDYGLAPGIDAAIRDLLARGRLSVTSVMVVTPNFRRSDVPARSLLDTVEGRPVIGLHLTLTARQRPLNGRFGPLIDGAFPPLGRLMALAFARRLDPVALADEIAAQFDAFATAFGRPPDFVDGHQHVQLLPQVRDALLTAMPSVAPAAWARQCGRALPLPRRFADRKGLFLDLLSHRFRRLAAARGVPTNPAFAGTYDYGSGASLAALFSGFLDGLPDGGLIMCHPGTVDDELLRLDPLTTVREQELAYLASDAFAAALEREGVALA